MIYRFSNRISGCLLTAVALMQLIPALKANVPGAKVSQSAGNANPTVLPPGSAPHGHTYAEWSEKWWQYVFALPVDHNPIAGADCGNGQSGQVWFLVAGPTTVNCAVPAGKALFFPIINSECSSLEAPPFFGATPADRLACAKSFIDSVTFLAAMVDGVAIQNLSAYRFRSPDFTFTVPDNNILGVPGPVSGQSTADGYYLMLAPLSAGHHTIHVMGTLTFGGVFSIDTTFTLTAGQ